MYFHVFSIPSLFSSLGSRIMWPSSQQSLERSALLRHFALPDAAESSSRLSPILSESDQADDKAWSFLSLHAVLHLTKSMLSNKRCDKLRQNYATYKRQGHVFFQSTWHRDTLLLHHGNQPWTWPWRAMRPRVSMGPSHKSSLEHWIKPFPKNAMMPLSSLSCWSSFHPAFPSSNSGARQRPNPLISCSCPDLRKRPLPQWPSHWPLKHLTVGQHSPFAMASWAQHPVVILPGPQLHWPNARLPVVSVGKLWNRGIWWNRRKVWNPSCSKTKLLLAVLASMKLGECEVATFLP